MKRKLVLGLALLALVPMLGCQKGARLPDIIAEQTGFSSSSPASVTQRNTATSAVYSGQTGQMVSRSLSIGGQERTFYVYAPASTRGGQPAPMVLAFHGGGGGAEGFVQRMHLISMADRYGMVLVVPQGLGRKGPDRGSWNADSMSPTGFAERNGIDDMGFVEALMRTVPKDYAIDRNRVFAMGFSKGGMMAYRAACMLRGQITSVAVVAATMSSANCPNPQGVSVLHIHGTDDENVPLNGGFGAMTGPRADWPAVSRGLEFFKRGNQCFGKPESLRIASDTSCTIDRCGNNEKVELCLVQGGGHAWPGAQPANWQINRGVDVTQSFDASDYIARFFLSQ